MTRLAAPVELILKALDGVHRSANGATAKCPAHDDHRNSLSVSEGEDGRALVRCHAGCEVEQVLGAVGMTTADLFARRGSPRILAEYEYRDTSDELVYVVVRFEPKEFRQKRPDGSGGWIWNLKGITPLLYRLPQLVRADVETPVLICEGEKDVERVSKLGFVATTNSSGAGKWTNAHASHLNGRNVVILPDNDDAGRSHAEKVAESLQGVARSICVLELPGLRPKGDVSDWVNSGGSADELRTLIAAAPSYAEWVSRRRSVLPPEVVSLEHLERRVAELWENGMEPGVSTGWASLDEYYTVKRGQWTVITGIPGHGKTSWLDQLLVNLVQRHEWRFVIFSAELSPELHAVDILEKFARKPFRDGPTPRLPKESALGMLRTAIHHGFRFINTDTFTDLTVDRILEITEQVASHEAVHGLVIDPWNELTHERREGFKETDYISDQLGKIRRFARRLNLHVWIIAHPQKMQKDPKTGKYLPPTPYEVAGSANWRNKADCALCIFRDITARGDEPEVEIHIQKIRRREVGRVGRITLTYDRITGRYEESIERGDDETKRFWATA